MKRLVWSILVLLPLGAIAEDVYRSVDANGVVVFSDRPTPNSEHIVIDTQQPTPRAPPVAAASGRDNVASPQVIAEIAPEPDPAAAAANRARNCEIARQTSETYNQSRRLFRAGPDGEREYLSDAELTEARAAAEADVAAWCD